MENWAIKWHRPWIIYTAGGCLNIKMYSYQYRDSHVKDKTVSPTILSLTWESPYLVKTVFILRRAQLVQFWWVVCTEGDIFQYGIRHRIGRTWKDSATWDWVLRSSNHFEILLPPSQQCCSNACQISFRVIGKVYTLMSCLQDFKTEVSLVINSFESHMMTWGAFQKHLWALKSMSS